MGIVVFGEPLIYMYSEGHSMGRLVLLIIINITCSGTLLYPVFDKIESPGNVYLLSIHMEHALSRE